MSIYTQPLIAARYTTTAGQSIANSGMTIVDFGTKDYDTVGAVTTGGSWKFTAPKSGYFDIKTSITFLSSTVVAGNSLYVALFKNGTVYSYPGFHTHQASGTYQASINAADSIYLLKGEYIDLRVFFNRTAGATQLDTAAGAVFVDINEIAAPTQSVGNDVKVLASYSNSAGTAVGATSVTVDLPFTTKEYDTHNSMTSSNVFTAPVTGYYEVDINLGFVTPATATGGVTFDLFITPSSGSGVFRRFNTSRLGTIESCDASKTFYLTKGQTITFAMRAYYVGATAPTLWTDAAMNNVSIKKL